MTGTRPQGTDGGPEAAVAARGLERSYRSGFLLARRRVLRGVDLDLAAGQTLGLIGPNGSGKSTLLRLLAGIDPPERGDLRVLGGDPRRAAVRLRVGYGPEDCPYPDELPARTVLGLVLRMRGRGAGEARRAAAALLDRVGLGADGGRSLRQYSSGMRRRFVLAVAFASEPDLVLLDEPSVGLDAEGSGVLEEFLDRAAERGAATLICSHRPDDLFGRCESVCVLIDGRVALVDGAEAIAARTRRIEIEIDVEGPDPGPLIERARRELSGEGLAVRGARPAATALDALYRSLGAGATGRDGGGQRDG